MHYYKFIVDGEWKHNPDEATHPDASGNINNCVDTTNTPSHSTMGTHNVDAQLADEPVEGSQYNEDDIVSMMLTSE